MPHNMACTQCQKVGYVRVEFVIIGTTSTKSYYCGACDHQWKVHEGAAAPQPKVRQIPSEARRKT